MRPLILISLFLLFTTGYSADPSPIAAAFHQDASSSDLLASGAFKLAVPFHSQKDGTRFAGSNCGPASLELVLEAFGNPQTNADLRWRSHTYQGTAGRGGGTALQFVAMAARDLGLDPEGLYDGQSFHQWSLADIRVELDLGQPVVPLVKYRLLPGHEGSTIRWDHYIVIFGVDGDRFLYHDPSFADPAEGSARWITSTQLQTAMGAASIPGQAVAFAPGIYPPLDVFTV